MDNKIEKLRQINTKLMKKVSNLENKTISLIHKIEKRNATIETCNAKLQTQKLEYIKKIFALETELDTLRKRKDGATPGDIMSGIAKPKDES